MEKSTGASKIDVTNIKPGDTIVLSYPDGLCMEFEMAQEIEKAIKSKLGDDVNILFIMGGAEMSILRKENAE